MNYPVWLLDAFGGGTLIALIAVVHVYVSGSHRAKSITRKLFTNA